MGKQRGRRYVQDEMYWAMKLSLSWDGIQCLQETNSSNSANTQFRTKFIDAAIEMHSALGVKDIGRLFNSYILNYKQKKFFPKRLSFYGLEQC